MRAILAGLLLLCSTACGGDDDDGETDGDADADGDVVERPDTVVAGIEYGSTCTADDECGDVAAGADCCTGGKCGPDGWCSPSCESDQDCPAGFFCIDHDGSRCFLACLDDRDCFPDWQCEDKSQRLTCRHKD